MMRLGMGIRLGPVGGGAAAPAFNPMSLSPLMWIDASDTATLFQDSAGTTAVTAPADPIGRTSDKSGNGRHLLQATSAARPAYRVTGGKAAWENDGVDDFLASAAGQTWPASCDVFIVISNPSNDTNFMLAYPVNGGANYLGVAASGDFGGVPTVINAVTVPTYVNNAATATRGAFYTATSGGAAKIVELRGVDIAALTQIQLGAYTGFEFPGRYHEVLIASAQVDSARTQYRDYLTAKWSVA